MISQPDSELAPHDEPSAPNRQGRFFGAKGCWIFGFFVLFAVICVLVGGYLMWISAAKHAVEERLAAIQAKGEPTNPTELNAWYTLPPGVEDTTPLWNQACEVFDSERYQTRVRGLPIVGDCDEEIPPPGSDWKHLEHVEALLEEYQFHMSLLHEAAAQGGHARFDYEFDKGIFMRMSNQLRLRDGARMLMLQAHVRAHRGDVEGTMETLRALFIIGRPFENDPTLIGQLVYVAINGIACATTIDLLPVVQFTDEQLAEIQMLLRQVDHLRSMKAGFIGDRVSTSEAFLRQDSFFEDDGNTRLGPSNEDLALYLDLNTQLIDDLGRTWPQALDTGEKNKAKVDKLFLSPFNRMRFGMTNELQPEIVMALGTGARGDAHRLTTDVLVAAKRYEMANGEFPTKLSPLVPKYLPSIPTDPFNGKPLRYTLRDGVPVVWSIGRDRTDDHGTGDETGSPNLVIELNSK